MKQLRGFTLVEMIMVIVITGIIAGMVAVFIATPVKGYVDTVRRAGLTDTADLALKRMALEIRTAVPNSLIASTNEIEFIPARTGGRYCTDAEACPTTNGDLDFGASDAGGNSFDVLGPSLEVVANDWLVVYNTGQCIAATCASAPALPCDGLNAYEGCNRRAVTTAAGTTSSLSFTSTDPPLTHASPSNRFQLVPTAGPVKFKCGTKELRRYTGYQWDHDESDATMNSLLADADALACTFTYNPLSATSALLTMQITLTREGESITLFSQIHVDNMP
jgi:MSHA biogenesis protein MshO